MLCVLGAPEVVKQYFIVVLGSVVQSKTRRTN